MAAIMTTKLDDKAWEAVWTDNGSKIYAVDMGVDKKSAKTLTSTTRVNSTTLASKLPTDILPIVKKKLLKKLYADLEAANVINIESVPNGKGGLIFTASLKVLPRE